MGRQKKSRKPQAGRMPGAESARRRGPTPQCTCAHPAPVGARPGLPSHLCGFCLRGRREEARADAHSLCAVGQRAALRPASVSPSRPQVVSSQGRDWEGCLSFLVRLGTTVSLHLPRELLGRTGSHSQGGILELRVAQLPLKLAAGVQTPRPPPRPLPPFAGEAVSGGRGGSMGEGPAFDPMGSILPLHLPETTDTCFVPWSAGVLTRISHDGASLP